MRETFPTPGPVLLSLRVPDGSIELEAVETDETDVEVEPLNEAAREALDSARIELRQRPGGGQEVVVELDDSSRRFGFLRQGPQFRLDIRCPRGAEVELKTGAADVEGSGQFAGLDIKSGSGDIAFELVEGEAAVKTASGDVSLGRVGEETTIHTASGDVDVAYAGGALTVYGASADVTIGHLLGPGSVKLASGDLSIGALEASLDAGTASGDQEIKAVSQGTLNLQSASGDVAVGVCQGSRLWVDARSRSGTTSSELEMSETPVEDEGPLVELRAATMSGDVRVFRAPARSDIEA
ncbi:MAG: DUF4097 family beta strand repeat protein [Actinobacteria bacterium]|nr:DUF4097 family beta strand repeat protein [Actinomycetota bacterium]